MENIKLSEVKKLLLEGFQPLADKHGYKVVKSKFALEKTEIDRTSFLSFTENHWFDEVQIMPAVEVSVHEIDEIIKRFSGVAVNFYDSTYWMNLNKLAYWYEDKSIEDFEYDDKDKYKIFNYTTDIKTAIQVISENFEKYGLRYIKEFGSVEGVDKLLNNYSKKLKDTDVLFLNKLILGPIVAKLLNRDYNTCIDFYTEYINQNKYEMSESYMGLFSQIKKHI